MLHKLQTSFLKVIYDPAVDSEAFLYIQETTGRSAAQQLEIYRSSIYGGLKKALTETYPVTKSLVGEEFFNAMLGRYIKFYPCQVQDLNDYGKELADFILTLKQTRSVPYLSDVTRLEWFYNIAINSEIQKNNLDELSNLSVEEQLHVRLDLPNGSALLQSYYPVDKIWSMHWEHVDDELVVDGRDLLLIILNKNTGVEINTLTEEQFYFLDQIKNAIPFTEICAAVIRNYPDVDIDSLFTGSIKNGWLQSYTIYQ